MRIRLPFAGVFTLLLLLAGYAGLSPVAVDAFANDDKALHLLTFFSLTVAFYWILDTNRRRTLNFTLIVCTVGLGIGSEFLQAIGLEGRAFDVFALVANVVGSLAALGLCSWYHKRMLERKRSRKQYSSVPGEEIGEEDIELGESVGIGSAEHEEGITAGETAAAPSKQREITLEQEVDNWDENAVDAWDEDDLGDIGGASVGAGKDNELNGVHGDTKKRAD
ncbi:hypothetical protein B0T25DRAFT_484831 [Lasiosphaeria hispida]|uniref:VanZ-like domain-containing protein n=1 Tax=Lasiosphaeria hispida TaxID=260671 RepID=A0AAJ0HCE3_9PEZI|nr:hypothetical protein B0T25DRAFT_484831 [Lasiosphaeria hispida]